MFSMRPRETQSLPSPEKHGPGVARCITTNPTTQFDKTLEIKVQIINSVLKLVAVSRQEYKMWNPTPSSPEIFHWKYL